MQSSAGLGLFQLLPQLCQNWKVYGLASSLPNLVVMWYAIFTLRRLFKHPRHGYTRALGLNRGNGTSDS